MKTLLLSSLVKVFKDTEPNFNEFNSFSCLKNESFSFQLALLAETAEETLVTFEIDSDIKNNITPYIVKNIPFRKNKSHNYDSFHYDVNRKEFPDLLEPTDSTVTLKPDEWTALWFEFKADSSVVGEHFIKITLSSKGETIEKEFALNIIDKSLPKQELLYTNWFHNDCLCTYYKVEVFSEDYWRIVENYIRNAAEHGVNMLLTPIFTPPLDTAVGGERPTVQLVKVIKENNTYSFDFTNFRRYVKLCLDCGIEAFEISHFFTQWGAKHAPKIIATVNGKEKRIFGWETKASGKPYRTFLEAFAPAFKEEVEALGIKEKCWLHVSDEPNETQITEYKKAANILRELFADFNMLDALSEIKYYKNGLIKTPVCGEDVADIFRPEVKDFWTYYCCTQIFDFLPNRMFAQPSSRNRVLGVLLYKYDAKGFLQWGHNFWYSQYSKRPINPFKITDAGGSFPSGDSFMVYPGKDGKPLNSLRHLVFFDAFQDLRALKLLESLTSREYVLNLIEQGLDVPLSFRAYPHQQQWLLDLRERINKEIEKR
ncbi:MAG: DUF4091 domain-containing protein [Acutalibacteraceae bacterium]|nr:DUF4091 domain-containing protein [Acutalibacteraceae bacterium]